MSRRKGEITGLWGRAARSWWTELTGATRATPLREVTQISHS